MGKMEARKTRLNVLLKMIVTGSRWCCRVTLYYLKIELICTSNSTLVEFQILVGLNNLDSYWVLNHLDWGGVKQFSNISSPFLPDSDKIEELQFNHSHIIGTYAILWKI